MSRYDKFSATREESIVPYSKLFSAAAVIALLLGASARADTDAEYIARFEEARPPVEAPPTLAEYATPERYDRQVMGDALAQAFKAPSNDSGGIAWGLSSRMHSLNVMYSATGNIKYLEANRLCIQAVLGATDEKRGKNLWTGRSPAAWGSDKYAAERGRALFPVHTGVIAAPMFHFLVYAREHDAYRAELGEEYGTILNEALRALAEHDRQWRDGPTPGEGHYVGMEQEPVLDDRPLPANRLSAMGWALYCAWKASGEETHRERAVAIGRYIKRRLTVTPEDAWFWGYWLPDAPVTEPAPRTSVKGEDTSHAGLSMRLALELGRDGHVFHDEDMRRFARTVTHGFGRLGNGVLFGNITGTPESSPKYVNWPARWLAFAPWEPAVRAPILAYYLRYEPGPGPQDLASLIRYGAPRGEELLGNVIE